MNTAVAFLGFNRPQATQRVFEAIRQVRPKQLLLVADGPRPDRPDDQENCAAVRAIVDKVDWPCDVQKNYAEKNLGCKRRVSSGLDWVFSQVKEAIILEDDCLPSSSFFSYCAELLERYRHDTRIMHIGGNNFQNGQKRGNYSYFFSKYNHIWGWATWRRAWKLYDVDMSTWPMVKDSGILRYFCDSEDELSYWSGNFDLMHAGKIDTWDYAWTYACFTNGLSVYPNVNLVSNIGFAADGTHCSGDSPLANLPTSDISPITHPPFIVRHQEADQDNFKNVFKPMPPPFAARFRNKHFYGSMIRKLPGVGNIWRSWRNRSTNS